MDTVAVKKALVMVVAMMVAGTVGMMVAMAAVVAAVRLVPSRFQASLSPSQHPPSRTMRIPAQAQDSRFQILNHACRYHSLSVSSGRTVLSAFWQIVT